MLMRIGEIKDLTEGERLATVVRGWVALCPETGAFLCRAFGHTHSGETKYTLILPNHTPAERGGLLARYDWDYPNGRKFVRAFSDQEAIGFANKKLAKMLRCNG